MQLISPTAEYEESYRAYIRELGTEVRHPFPLDFDHEDFPALLGRLDDLAVGRNVPGGFVPSTTYWLVDGPELLAVSNLRHQLSDRLREYGGHIGLGVRPSQRRKGHGSALLSLTVLEARKKGISDVHVHCHQGNMASERMIIGAGGILDSEGRRPGSSEVVLRYRIPPAPRQLAASSIADVDARHR